MLSGGCGPAKQTLYSHVGEREGETGVGEAEGGINCGVGSGEGPQNNKITLYQKSFCKLITR